MKWPVKPLSTAGLAAALWAAALASLLAPPAGAELPAGVLPTALAGPEDMPGVEVATRLRQDTAWQGVPIGVATLHPEIDQGFGYDGAALAGHRGSLLLESQGSLTLSDIAEGAGYLASLSLDHKAQLSAPSESTTDWTAGLAGTLPLPVGSLTAAIAHLALHETDDDLDLGGFDKPLPFTLDALRLSTHVDLGRVTLTPELGVAHFTFGDTTIDGLPAPQSYRDRTAFTGGLTLSTGLSGAEDPLHGLLILRGSGASYEHAIAGQPSRDAMGGSLLVGMERDFGGIWGWRLAIGMSGREFRSAAYEAQLAPVAEAALVWQPNERTTWQLGLVRSIEDAADEGVGGYVATLASLGMDHELKRDLILHAGIDLKQAAYQGGAWEGIALSRLDLLWLVNRNLRVEAKLDLGLHRGLGGDYPENAVMLSMAIGI